jgi:hypothetical protein
MATEAALRAHLEALITNADATTEQRRVAVDAVCTRAWQKHDEIASQPFIYPGLCIPSVRGRHSSIALCSPDPCRPSPLALLRHPDFNSPAVALTDLVLWLGAHLTSTDDVHRQRACATLAECLARGDRISLGMSVSDAGQYINSHQKCYLFSFSNMRSQTF